MKKIVNSLKELDNHEFIFENTLFKLCYNKNDRMLDFAFKLQSNDIKFVSISQPELDTTTHTGMLFFQIQKALV